MGKRSRARKRALPKAYKALRKIFSISEVYFNTSKFVEISKIAKLGLPKEK